MIGSMILLEPALKTAEDTDNVLKDQKPDNSKETVMEKQEGKEITGRENALKRTYDAVSENGDTVEISEAGRSLQAQENTDGNQYSLSEKRLHLIKSCRMLLWQGILKRN